jgi:hypothetical protein
MANDAQASRVYAYDFFVVSPDLHQADAVRLLKGFVERVFCFFGRGEHGCWNG